MHIFVINGFPMSGKDELVKQVKNLVGKENCLCVSTVDYVKEVAMSFGWDGVKDAASRRMLSDLKDTLTRWKDLPWRIVWDKINDFESSHSDGIVFIHVREPDEIARYCAKGAKSILIMRDSVVQEQSNHADSQVLNYNYDYIIENNGTLEDLRASAITLLENERS